MSQPIASSQHDSGQHDAGNSPAAGFAARLRTLVAENPTVVLFIVFVLLVLITGMVEPNYLSAGGLRTTLLQAAPLGILAAAQTILMLSGGIDLSLTMIATASAYVAANQSPQGAAIAIALGLLVGLVIGAANGAANGIGVAIFRVNPLIMTLAMSSIVLGLFTDWTQSILQGSTRVHELIRLIGGSSFLGNRIPYSLLIWVAIALIIFYVLRHSGWGRLLYAIGDNEVAARLAGVRVWQVRLTTFMVAGLLGAVGGICWADAMVQSIFS